MSPGANRVFETFGPRLRDRVPGWRERAAEMVAGLRMSGDSGDPRFQDVVGTLLARDPDFRAMWARQDVHVFIDGVTTVPVRPFGSVELRWQRLDVPGGAGFGVTTMFADPGTRAAGVLAFLAAEVDATEREPPRSVGE
jgi:hypothetical protein